MYVFTLHLKACDHTKFIFNFHWYGIRISFKSSYDFMVTALKQFIVSSGPYTIHMQKGLNILLLLGRCQLEHYMLALSCL